MRLAFVLPPIEPFSPRGLALSTIVWHTSCELTKLGHAIHVVSPSDPEGLYDSPDVLPVKIDAPATVVRRVRRRIGRAREWDWSDQDLWHRRVVDALRPIGGELDAIVALNDVQIHGAVRRAFPRVARATWLQNELGTAARRARGRDADVQHFLCCSDYIRAGVNRVVGPGARVSVVNNCVDVAAFHPVERTPDEAHRLKLLFIGRLDPNKGPDALVAALLKAKDVDPAFEFELTVAGPAISYGLTGVDYKVWLDALLRDIARLGGTFVGRVERQDLPDLYRAHDVTFVLSRSQEPFGMVALEAMACGNVVVCSDRGGLREATGGHTIYVDPDAIDGITRAILAISRDRQPYEEQRRAGTEWAANRGWTHAAAALLGAIGGQEN